jgi:uncharacterized repeat protein (TIGR01451 family)
MFSRRSAYGLAVLVLILALLPALAHASAARTTSMADPSSGSLQPVVVFPIQHDTLPALRDLPPAVAVEQPALREIPLNRLPKAQKAQTPFEEADAAIQSRSGPAAMPPTDFHFEGIANLFGGWPPDTQGDIGANHYIQWINLHFAIWSIDRAARTATLVYGPTPGNTLWQGFGGACETTNNGDPITLYDAEARRWFMSQFALPNFPNGPFYVCIAVSTTDDPTGAWYRYAYQWTNGAGQPVMNDYPKFGVWPDGYYMTVNQFAAGSLSWAGAGVAVFERDRMLQGLGAQMVKFDLYGVNPAFGGMLPSDLDGPTLPPIGAPNIFAEVDDGAALPPNDALRLWQFHVDWTNPLSSTFGVNGQPSAALAVAAFNPLGAGIPQPGTGQTLDTLADRLMYRLAYRNFGDHAALVVNHTVDAGASRAGVRWYEVRDPHGSPVIYQQGTYAPADGLYRWMGSIAQDHNGNAALGYSVSSSTVYPSIRYAGRLSSDPLGEMSQGEAEIIAGAGSQTGHYRWGDYSMMGIDPTDDCTFWYTQEYVQTTGSNTWRTHIGAFKFPSCSAGPQGTLAGVVSDAATSNAIVGAQVRATASVTQTASATSGANGVYSMRAQVGVYTVTASAYAYQPAQISGVSIVSGTTTTLNLTLTPAAVYVVSGTVRDAVTGWPLYAKLDIAGYPGGPIWNNPVTGYYSITLAEGITYTFNVDGGIPGYLPASQSIGPLTSNRTENFSLNADPVACHAPGYQISRTSIYSKTFEADNGGYTMSGFTSWAWGMPTSGPGSAHSGINAWATNLSGNYYDYEDGYITSPNIDLSAYSGQAFSLDWWQWLQTEGCCDYASVEASNDGGATWVRVFGEMSGFVDLAWAQRTITLDPANAVSNFRMRFRFRTDGSVTYPGWYVDDVNVTALTCSPQAGGLIVGNVYDANTSSALNGATVGNDLGQTTTTFATPGDPTIDDAFYVIFSQAGAHPITSTISGGYGTEIHTPTVVQSSTIRLDFNLPSGRLFYTPPSMSATLELGASTTRPFTLTNDGGLAAAFEFIELDKGVTPLGPIEKPEFSVKPFRQNFVTTQGLGLPLLPSAPPYAAGDVIQSWSPAGLGTAPWGIAYDSSDNTVWVAEGWGVTDSVIEYAPNGAPTGRAWTYTLNPNGPADMAFNLNTGRAWIMNVASPDNCIYEMNPATGLTGAKICPSFGLSQRGLAYDPSTDTYFAGSWNDMMIHHFDSTGVMLDEVNVGLPIAGLAYNPDTMHLFVMVNNSSNPVFVLDAANNYALLGQFNVGQGFGPYSGAGLEFDCDGNLWAVDQATNTVYQFQSGETTSMCARDVPWLSESTISGTIASLAQQPIVIAFDAGVPQITQPGQYYAQLKVKEETPYQVLNVPLTLTVTAPATWGKLTGTVTGLGYCDANPAPLADADVFVQSGSGLTRTITTNASGVYQLWLNQLQSPLTVTITAADHQTSQAVGVIITGQVTTTASFDLRWLRPCLDANPTRFALAVDMGASITLPLTITNRGARLTAFELFEQAGGSILSLPAHRVIAPSPGAAAVRSDQADAFPVQPTVPRAVAESGVLLIQDYPAWGHNAIQSILSANNISYTVISSSQMAATDFSPYRMIIIPSVQGVSYNQAFNANLTKFENYIDAGGLVLMSFCEFSGDMPYRNIPFGGANNWGGAYDNYIVDPDHPIFAGVPNPYSGNYASHNFLSGLLPTDRILVTSGNLPGGNVVMIEREHGAGMLVAGGQTFEFGWGNSQAAGIILSNTIPYYYNTWVGHDVPWLSEAPITGTLAADSAQTVAVTFNADIPEITQPGDYFATLNVASDDPVNPAYVIPVTMTAVAPATWGKLGGTVTGLGYCDAAPGIPLDDATVFIQSGSGLTWTMTTNVSGMFQVWMHQARSPLTLTVSFAGYVTKTVAGVTVSGQQTTTHNIALRLNVPCAHQTPPGLSLSLVKGNSGTMPLTVTNAAAGALTYVIYESELQLAPSQSISVQSIAQLGTSTPPIRPTAPLGPASVRSLPAQAADGRAQPASPAWFNGLPVPGGLVRYAHAQCDDRPDSFYVISGVDSMYSRTANVWRFDVSTNTWHALAPIPIGQEGPTAVCYQGKIYVLGGSGTNPFYIYTIATNTWSAGAALPRNVWGAAAGAWNGRVYLIGGDSDFYSGGTSGEVNVYDIAANAWLTATSGLTMPVAAVTPGYVQAGPYVYVVGGWGDASPTKNLTTTQRYDMSANTWTIGPAFTGARADFALALTGEALYAIGGDADGNGFFEPSTTVDRLDWSNWPGGAWTSVDPLPTAMTSNNAGFCTSAVTSSEIWSVAGYSGWINNANFFRPSPSEACYSIYSDVPWLSTTPASGAVPGDSHDQVNVALDATSLMPGNYHATLVIHTSDGNAPEFRVPVTLTVSAAMPNLSTSTKTVNQTVANPGDTLTYTLTVVNTGNTAANVTLLDPIPANLTYSLGSASNAVYNDAAGRIEWTGALAAGTQRVITFRATIDASVSDGTLITNTLALDDGVNSPVVKIATTVIGNRPDLSTSTKTVDRAQVNQGGTVTYTIAVINTGNVAASVTVTDPLPSGARYVPGSGTTNSAPSSLHNDVANRVEWSGSVPSSSSIVLAFRAVITAAGGTWVTNTVSIADGLGTIVNREAGTRSMVYSLYLPAVRKN